MSSSTCPGADELQAFALGNLPGPAFARLADHVIQHRMGHADLEFGWVDLRPADPAEQAKMLDIYVRNGIYAVNEARDILGFDPVAGGELPMVYGSEGPVSLAAPASRAAVKEP